MKAILNLFPKRGSINYRTEALSGVTVSLILIPEAIAFAMIANLSPIIGLYAAFVMCLITAIFGGRPGMISGATAAVAIVYQKMAKESEFFIDLSNGLTQAQFSDQFAKYVFATAILAGLIQLCVGLFRLAKFVRLIPTPAILGFVNGLGIVIFLGQIQRIQQANTLGENMLIYVGLVLLTMLIMWGLPRLTRAIPSALAAILVVNGITFFGWVDTVTISDITQNVSGGFPSFSLPDIEWSWELLQILLPYAAIVAGVGLIETLLTLNLVDALTKTRGRGNKEAIAQGSANMLSGMFGGMGGCALVGQSLINVSSGSRTRVSGVVAAILLLVFVMFGSGFVKQMPMPALVGLMIMVSFATFEWTSLRAFGRMPRQDIFVMLLVTILIPLLHDIATAVLVGVIISALAFAWHHARNMTVKIQEKWNTKTYLLDGPLFFGSTTSFDEMFDPEKDPKKVIIDFARSRVTDMSAIDVINKVSEKYLQAGKELHLKHLSPDCQKLLKNASKIVEVNIMEDPTYGLVINHKDRK